jgi:plastocyanin
MRFFFVALLLLSSHVHASTSVRVVDQHGVAVVDAVVSFPSQPDTAITPHNMPVAVMDQVNMQFQPHVLIVSKDQKVSFPNSDDTRHHVYSFSEPKVFELKLFKGTSSEPVQMQTPGIVELGCNIHDQMLGFIYVDASGSATKTNSSGLATLNGEQQNTIMVWHPRLQHTKGQLLAYPINIDSTSEYITVVIDLKPLPVLEQKNRFRSRFTNQPAGPAM